MEVSIRAGANGCLVCIRFLPFLPFHLLSRPHYISFIFFSIPIYSLYPFPPILVLIVDLSNSSPSSTHSPSAPIHPPVPSSLPRPAFLPHPQHFRGWTLIVVVRSAPLDVQGARSRRRPRRRG
ncbi:hypothetical protein DFP72DRAFT_400792 [Ephemerocybe angulata]|uniref:Uncharacterized protein n=1 Tax=Ephemerocybe angulata TaxID=980116 RepID=A0A8H6HXL9_9AGAR|nr:hypothetical protein DFP72DRAFT_400792 [Tulosesus angulatus]